MKLCSSSYAAYAVFWLALAGELVTMFGFIRGGSAALMGCHNNPPSLMPPESCRLLPVWLALEMPNFCRYSTALASS